MNRLFALFGLAFSVALSTEKALLAQSNVSVADVADELAGIASFVQARSVFEADREIVIREGETYVQSERVLSTDRLVMNAGAQLLIDPDTKGFGENGVYIVTRELTLPEQGGAATISWAPEAAPPPPKVPDRAASGANGHGAGEPGKPGQNGKDGLAGAHGADAPRVTVVLQQVNGGNLIVDLSGGAGGDGGRGQMGGSGGDGARGTSARTAWVKVFNSKTAVGCAAGPGRGGNGGNGGNGGRGGDGGTGGSGGTLRLISSAEVAKNVFETIKIEVASGPVGRAGIGGLPGTPGRGGPEGKLATSCGSAGRQGANGAPGDTGPVGADGKSGREGTIESVVLSLEQIQKAFGFEER